MLAKLADGMKIRCFCRLVNSFCKGKSDLIMVCWADSISFRTINDTQSALPILLIKENFFDEYEFTHNENKFTAEIPVSYIKYALKYALFPSSIIININSENSTLTIEMVDYYEISHKWVFALNETIVYNAVYDMTEVTGSLTCRWDIFDGMDKAFKGNEMVTLHFNKKNKRHPIVFHTQELFYKDKVSCILRLESSENCDLKASDEMKITFSLSDFIFAIKICSVLSQKANIYCIGPGSPLIIKADMPNNISFEMALGTSRDEEEEDNENQEEEGKASLFNKKGPVVFVPNKNSYLSDEEEFSAKGANTTPTSKRVTFPPPSFK
ncbi:hypothetical protein TRFO_19096 [Tritrichomonas foetus]|uniref:Proliferating cell nuclear antigen n=1 Tax=Tritrichomonas foetus TaxID=1144522 RepID=A0A1J4KJE5_9EUKA|nr:hypothetical protein TRFO_19096 [Tritrichomonas foetus]|eukprot:OHT11457.1 hypothetical protein TRFO_19096 [Tritrichomonas foetus]